jgi:hypothetical protein
VVRGCTGEAEAEAIQPRLMAGRAAPYAFPGGREGVDRGEVEAPGVGMVVREHIDIGPAFGAGGDQVGLAVLAGLLLGDESGNLDRADKVWVGPAAGIGVAPPIAERRVAFGDAVAGIVGISGGFNRVEGALQGHGGQVFGGRMELVLQLAIFGLSASFFASS